ncbi:MAG: hypothetical protein V2A53_08100 [bacterium]
MSNITYTNNENENAALSFACGISVRMAYSSNGSGAWTLSGAYKNII